MGVLVSSFKTNSGTRSKLVCFSYNREQKSTRAELSLVLRPHLLIWVTVVLYDSDPGQHVLPAFRLEQILAVGGCEPQHILAPRVAVGDVNEAGLDANSQGFLLKLRGSVRDGILPVLVQCQAVAL